MPSLFELLEIVTQQAPTFVPDVQQIVSEIQECKPFQSRNSEEESYENNIEQTSNPGKVKDKVNKLFNKQGNLPFWKK